MMSMVPGLSALAQSRTFLAYAGNYSAATEYSVSDLVSDGGEFYVSLTANNVGNPPASSASQWARLGSGASGPPGPVWTGRSSRHDGSYRACGSFGADRSVRADGTRGAIGSCRAAGASGRKYFFRVGDAIRSGGNL